jgi:hypothetical protein
LDSQVNHRRFHRHASSATQTDLEKQVPYWLRDFRGLSAFFEQNKATVWDCIPTWLHSDRQTTFSLITEFVRFDQTINTHEHRPFVIYWFSHRIFRSVVPSRVWTLSMHGDHVESISMIIIPDTCFSDAWLEILRRENVPRLAYQAACRADENAFIYSDGHVSRSLLMCKIIIESPWTREDQHPMHLYDDGVNEMGEELCDGQEQVYSCLQFNAVSSLFIDICLSMAQRSIPNRNECCKSSVTMMHCFNGRRRCEVQSSVVSYVAAVMRGTGFVINRMVEAFRLCDSSPTTVTARCSSVYVPSIFCLLI